MAQAQASQKIDQSSDPQSGATLILERHFKAPREAVFKAFTEAEELAKWFGPREITCKNVTSDPRPGGGYFMEFHSKDGHEISLLGTYKEVVPHERLVYTWIWDRGDYGSRETLVTITFEASAEGGTNLTLMHENLRDEDARTKHNGGWNSCLDCLEEMLAA